MPLHDSDAKQIAKKLSISVKLVNTLAEEERDSNLLLSVASTKSLKKEDALKLTFLTYIKLVVFRYSYDTGFDIDEKLYISKIVYYMYLDIKKGLNYELIMDKSGPSEKKSQYLLLLAGLFHDVTPKAIFFPGFQRYIDDGFRKKMELRPLAQHVWEWIEILKTIKNKGLLDPISIKPPKKSKIKPRLLLAAPKV